MRYSQTYYTVHCSNFPRLKQPSLCSQTIRANRQPLKYPYLSLPPLSVGGAGGGGHNPMDIFDMFFGGGMGRGRSDMGRERKGRDMVHPLKVRKYWSVIGLLPVT